MLSARHPRGQLGNEPPLLADGRRAPDRREISLRWLTGTFLTGITSCALMGIALFAAVDGREQLALPGEAVAASDPGSGTGPKGVAKGGRIVAALAPARPTDREIMEVSTLFRDGDRDVVRRRPFAHIKVALAANHTTDQDYPAFDPLAIVAENEPDETETDLADAGVIYGAQVESEITLRTTDFPADPSGQRFEGPGMSAEEAEEAVRSNGSLLTGGVIQVAALHYVDPQRFADFGFDLDFSASLNSRIITENVSVSVQDPLSEENVEFAEDVIPVSADGQIVEIMRAAGYDDTQCSMVSGLFANFNSSSMLEEGDVLRLGIEQAGAQARIIRASVYSGTEHELTLAENDRGFFVRAAAPSNADIVASVLDADTDMVPAVSGRELPTVYDGIYRAALSYGLNQDLTGQIIRLLASDVDFQARLRPTDKLEAFFSVAEETGRANENSELLYVHANFGDTTTQFYRFRDPEDGSVDYFDADGRSVRQFLLRNPVPNGRFSSPYGMRRHPILGYSRMHAGVDWAAPTGTPIIAPGDGVVLKAGWNSGGFGRHTEVRHANGYVTTYSHQSQIAKGVSPGATVRQGQVIGYVGSTGMSTGPHLHYEMTVNGSKVDPLRVRLPDASSLEGDALAAFRQERDRIDALLGQEAVDTEVASR
ncbi:M23 family metallopeptidase [Pararhizobium haloflavum]|uniref:M23 family metallopeptidase n=1 Tax=Pararhizobium haloflavum TaxID=2037914 RepID=UPI000C195915|nr:M23 family metallopeptidase [Pararhizobium haloflavum]